MNDVRIRGCGGGVRERTDEAHWVDYGSHG